MWQPKWWRNAIQHLNVQMPQSSGMTASASQRELLACGNEHTLQLSCARSRALCIRTFVSAEKSPVTNNHENRWSAKENFRFKMYPCVLPRLPCCVGGHHWKMVPLTWNTTQVASTTSWCSITCPNCILLQFEHKQLCVSAHAVIHDLGLLLYFIEMHIIKTPDYQNEHYCFLKFEFTWVHWCWQCTHVTVNKVDKDRRAKFAHKELQGQQDSTMEVNDKYINSHIAHFHQYWPFGTISFRLKPVSLKNSGTIQLSITK